MNLICYVDESGTHDETGQATGAREAVLGAIIARPETWRSFCRDWQGVLNEYGAPYFHFCEWSYATLVARGKRKPNSKFEKNPYHGWSHTTLDQFIIKLARVAGSEDSGKKVMWSPCVRTDRFYQHQTQGRISKYANPYIVMFKEFFDGVFDEIAKSRPHWKSSPVSFFFDQTNTLWSKLASEWFTEKKKCNPLMDSISFEDKRKHLPLQAADMVAYRMRQVTANLIDDKPRGIWEAFDNALFHPVLSNHHTDSAHPDDVRLVLRSGLSSGHRILSRQA